MSTDTEYHGWKNYPTWVVNAWLNNEESTYRTITAMAREQVAESSTVSSEDRYGLSIRDSARVTLADQLQTYVEDLAHRQLNYQASFVTDIVGWALADVDWREITSHLVDEALEAEAEAQDVAR